MPMHLRLIGGLIFWDRERPLRPEELSAMASKVDATAVPHHQEEGSVGMLSTLEPESLESSDRMWAVSDMDLTNLNELQDLAGTREDGSGLLGALYAIEGPSFVRRLRGGFALALWDRRQRSLLLAVDQFGIKRLHYTTDHRGTAFASRPSALLAAPDVEARVDPAQVYNYLNFGFVPAPESIFAGIRRLPPGTLLVFRNGEGNVKAYWDMAYPERPVGKAEGAATLYKLTEQAVGHVLQGLNLKEVGAFLSGGTDSSTVVGMMGRVAGAPAKAFSIGFREKRYDELGYAELAARHFGAAHYTQIVTPEEALDALPGLVDAYDEPFANNSAIGTFFCAQLAQQNGVSCLITGDGGDEIFGGNERYRTDRIFARYHRIPRVIRLALLEPLLLNLPNGGSGLFGKAQRYVRRANIPNPRRFYSYEFFFAQERDRLLAPDFLAAVDAGAPYEILQAHYDRVQTRAELNRLMYLDLKLTIGDSDLFKVTRTAELVGVALRFPLLDLPLVEFTGTWPPNFKVRGLEKRFLFKQAFRELLPQETLAKEKHGFGVPVSDWFKNHSGFRALAQDTLLSSRAKQRGYFHPGAVEDLLQRHADDVTPYYGDILWIIFMLELWHRRHLNGEAVA
jgi:asparagine synthase (glutamine-hydrolysing)